MSWQQKFDLLDRAAQHLRATTEPDNRVFAFSRVAVRLFALGKKEEAKKIVEIVTPVAKHLPPKTNAAAGATAGEAIGLFDLPAGLQLIKATRGAGKDYYSMPALFHIAYRIAKQQPAEAERIAVEAIDFAKRSILAYYRKEIDRDPTEDDLGATTTWYENRLVPLCYSFGLGRCGSGPADGGGDPQSMLAGLCRGNDRQGPRALRKVKARQLILQAYDILTEAGRNPDRRWPQLPWNFGPSDTAAALLPVVEEIDPALVGECLWRAVSFRMHRPADQFLVGVGAGSRCRHVGCSCGALRSRRGPRIIAPGGHNGGSGAGRRRITIALPALAAIDATEALGTYEPTPHGQAPTQGNISRRHII